MSPQRTSSFDSFAVSPSPHSAGPSQPPLSIVYGVYFWFICHYLANPLSSPPLSASLSPPAFLAFLSLASLIVVIFSLTDLFVYNFFLLSSSTCCKLVAPALCIVTVSCLFFFLLRLNSSDNHRRTQIDTEPWDIGTMLGWGGNPMQPLTPLQDAAHNHLYLSRATQTDVT